MADDIPISRLTTPSTATLGDRRKRSDLGLTQTLWWLPRGTWRHPAFGGDGLMSSPRSGSPQPAKIAARTRIAQSHHRGKVGSTRR